MTFPLFLKRKSTYIVLVVIAALGGWLWMRQSAKQQSVFETVAVEQGNVVQTVEVTGGIRPASRIDLSFKGSGTLKTILAHVGDAVLKDQVLAELKDDDLVFAARAAGASLSIAQANLNARLAGETAQSIKVAAASVEQAQAAYVKAVSDLASTKISTQQSVVSAEIALQTARNNLDNQSSIVNQNIQNAYDSARTSLLTALGPLQSGLTDGDQIIGVDNSAANQSYLNVLGFLDSGSMPQAKSSYQIAKASHRTAESAVKALSSGSTKQDILDAASKLQKAISDVQAFLTDVQKVLSSSLTSSSFTASDLSAKKATIDADRTSVSAQNTAVLNATQSIKGTELTQTQTVAQLNDAYLTASSAYETAKVNAQTQVASAQSAVTIQQAALDSAQATLDLKKSPPRAVDIQNLRASVEQAQVSADKAQNDLKNAQITAPVDGIISDVIPDLGSQIMAGVAVMRMVGVAQYDIEAQVPEADISKVKVGQTATITLDAYGDSVKFTGTVTQEDPDQTRVQDAVYYNIRVQIDPAGHDVKPGMTANVTITTGQQAGVMVIPLRAVRTAPGSDQKTVRVLVGAVAQEKNITLGLRGDEGRVEVVNGLAVGDLVVLSETKAGVSVTN